MRVPYVLVVIGVAIWSGACGSSSSPAAPAAVVVSSAAVKSMHVTGPALVVGDTKQFTATASFADGTQQDVSGLSSWSTSNTTVATVDQTGKVTAIGQGEVYVRAAFRGVTDSEYHNVTPLLYFKAAGTVAEIPPGFAAVPNARIEIVAGANMGNVTTSDANGNFSFGTMRGDDYTFKVSRDGYQDLQQKVALTRDLTNISVLLYPAPPAGATARCKNRSWSYAPTRASACTADGGVAYWVCPGPLCNG